MSDNPTTLEERLLELGTVDVPAGAKERTLVELRIAYSKTDLRPWDSEPGPMMCGLEAPAELRESEESPESDPSQPTDKEGRTTIS